MSCTVGVLKLTDKSSQTELYDPMLTAFVILFSAYIVAALLRENGRKTLSSEQKVALGDRLSVVRKFGAIPVLAIAIATYGRPLRYLIWGVAICFAALQLTQLVIVNRTLKGGPYVRNSRLEFGLVAVALVAFVLIALRSATV
jgi:hypothetical protein